MSQYVLEMYRQMFTSLRRGNTRGVYSNAKPIFLLSILDYIPLFKNSNQLLWGDKILEDIYISKFNKYDTSNPTPFWKPFYYMSSEPFYSLIWRESVNEKSIKYPSGKILYNFLKHAKLDEQLWELLQNNNNREYLRNSIITHYFSHK